MDRQPGNRADAEDGLDFRRTPQHFRRRGGGPPAASAQARFVEGHPVTRRSPWRACADDPATDAQGLRPPRAGGLAFVRRRLVVADHRFGLLPWEYREVV